MSVIDGSIAVVTGGARGLGKRIGEALAAQGVIVALLGRDAGTVSATAAAIGRGCFGIGCDVSDPAAVRDAFAAVKDRAGCLDILINNAAVSHLHAIEDASDDAIMSEIGVNLAGPIFCSREAIPMMRAAGGGDIVNISSESTRQPFPHLTIYAATKGGLETFSTGLRSELQKDGIRVTTVRAGHMGETSISEHWSAEKRKAWDEQLKRLGLGSFTGPAFPPAIVADAIVNLLSMPRAARVDMVEIRSGIAPVLQETKT